MMWRKTKYLGGILSACVLFAFAFNVMAQNDLGQLPLPQGQFGELYDRNGDLWADATPTIGAYAFPSYKKGVMLVVESSAETGRVSLTFTRDQLDSKDPLEIALGLGVNDFYKVVDNQYLPCEDMITIPKGETTVSMSFFSYVSLGVERKMRVILPQGVRFESGETQREIVIVAPEKIMIETGVEYPAVAEGAANRFWIRSSLPLSPAVNEQSTPYYVKGILNKSIGGIQSFDVKMIANTTDKIYTPVLIAPALMGRQFSDGGDVINFKEIVATGLDKVNIGEGYVLSDARELSSFVLTTREPVLKPGAVVEFEYHLEGTVLNNNSGESLMFPLIYEKDLFIGDREITLASGSSRGTFSLTVATSLTIETTVGISISDPYVGVKESALLGVKVVPRANLGITLDWGTSGQKSINVYQPNKPQLFARVFDQETKLPFNLDADVTVDFSSPSLATKFAPITILKGSSFGSASLDLNVLNNLSSYEFKIDEIAMSNSSTIHDKPSFITGEKVIVNYYKEKQVIYVNYATPATSASAQDGRTWKTAYATVQQALPTTSQEAKQIEIQVAGGTYNGEVIVVKGVNMIGGCVSDAETQPTRTIFSDKVMIESLEIPFPSRIENCTFNHLVSVGKNSTLKKIVVNAQTRDTNILYINGGTVQEAIVKKNTTTNGAVVCLMDGVIENSQIIGNKSKVNGGGLFMVKGTLTNNVIANNETTKVGGGVYATGDVTLINNTIVRNQSTSVGGVYISTVNSKLHNNVVWGNGTGDQINPNITSPFENSALENVSLGGSNISLSFENNGKFNSPCFINPSVKAGVSGLLEDANWGILYTSRLASTGGTALSLDINGTQRHLPSSIGAYEINVLQKGAISLISEFNGVGHSINLTAKMTKEVVREDVHLKLNYSDRLSLVNPPSELVIKAGEKTATISINTDVRHVGSKEMTITGELMTAKKVVSEQESNLISQLSVTGKSLIVELQAAKTLYHDGELMKIKATLPKGVTFSEPINAWVNLGDYASHFLLDGNPVINDVLLQIKAYETASEEITLRVTNVMSPLKATFTINPNDFIAANTCSKTFDLAKRKYYISIGATKSVYTESETVSLFAQLNDEMQNLTGETIAVDMGYQPEVGGVEIQNTLNIAPGAVKSFSSIGSLSVGRYTVDFNDVLSEVDYEVTQRHFAFEVVGHSGLALRFKPKTDIFTEGDSVIYTAEILANNGNVFVNNDTRIVYLNVPDTELKGIVDSFIIPLGVSSVDVAIGTAKQYLGAQNLREFNFKVDSVYLPSSDLQDQLINYTSVYVVKIDDTTKPLAKVEFLALTDHVTPGDYITLTCNISGNISDVSSNKISIPIGFTHPDLWELSNVDSNKFMVSASGDGVYTLRLYPKFFYQSKQVLTNIDFTTHESLINVGTQKVQIDILAAPKIEVQLATSTKSVVEGESFQLHATIIKPQYLQFDGTIQVDGTSKSISGPNILRPVAFTIMLSKQLDGSFEGSTKINVMISEEKIMRVAEFELNENNSNYIGINKPTISVISNKIPTLSFSYLKSNLWGNRFVYEGNKLQVKANLSQEYGIPQTVSLIFSDSIFDAPEKITFPANAKEVEFVLTAKNVPEFYGLRTTSFAVDSSLATLLMVLPDPIELGVVDSPLLGITLTSTGKNEFYEGDSFNMTATLDQINVGSNPIQLILTNNGQKTDSFFMIKSEQKVGSLFYKTFEDDAYQGPQRHQISVDVVEKPYKTVDPCVYTIFDRNVTASFSIPTFVEGNNVEATVSLNKVNKSGKPVVLKLKSSVAGEFLISIANGDLMAKETLELQKVPVGSSPSVHTFTLTEVVGDKNGIKLDQTGKILTQYPKIRIASVTSNKTTIRHGESLDFHVTMLPANDGIGYATVKLALDEKIWGTTQGTVLIPPGQSKGKLTLKSLDKVPEDILATTISVVDVPYSIEKDPKNGEISIRLTEAMPIVSFANKQSSVTFENVEELSKMVTVTLNRSGDITKELTVSLSIVPTEGLIRLSSSIVRFAANSPVATVNVTFENPKKAIAPLEAILSLKNEGGQYAINLNSTHSLLLNSTIEPGDYTGFSTAEQRVNFTIQPQLLIVWGTADQVEVSISGKGIKSGDNCRLTSVAKNLEFSRKKYIVRRLNNELSTVLGVFVESDVLKKENLAIKFKITKATFGAWKEKIAINSSLSTHTLVLINDKPIINNDLLVHRHFVDSNPFITFDPLKNDLPFVENNLSKLLIIEGVSIAETGPFDSSMMFENCFYRISPDLTQLEIDYSEMTALKLADGVTQKIYYKVLQPGASSGVAFIDVSLGTVFANQAHVDVLANRLPLIGNTTFPRKPAAFAMYYDRFKDPSLIKPRKRTFAIEKTSYPADSIRLKVASLPKLYNSKVLSRAMSNGLYLSELLSKKEMLFQYDNLNMPIQMQVKGIIGVLLVNAQTYISAPATITQIADTVIKDYSGYKLIELKGEAFSQKPIVYLSYRKAGYTKVYRTKLPVMKSYKNTDRQKITFPVTDPVLNCSIFVRLPKQAPKNSVSYELQFENGVGYTAVENFDLNKFLNQ